MNDVPRIETRRFLLTVAGPDAAKRYAAYAVENDAHLAPWEPPRPDGYFTEIYWQRRLQKNREEAARDASLRLGIFPRDEPRGPLLGHANFSQIIRGGFQSCFLGYSLAERSVGKGVMTEALAAALPYVFEDMGLHRVQANYVPTNERSGRLLRKLGFVVEGYARDYLFIGGAWRDHVLTALTNARYGDRIPTDRR